MYGNEHYLSKIERNTEVLDKAPENVRAKCAANIEWARNLSARLELLDYDERNKAVIHMNEVLDEDYTSMGFELPEEEPKLSK